MAESARTVFESDLENGKHLKEPKILKKKKREKKERKKKVTLRLNFTSVKHYVTTLSQNGSVSLATFKYAYNLDSSVQSTNSNLIKESLKERGQPWDVENTPFYYAPSVTERPDIRNTVVQHLEAERKQEG